jgi:hypothetical protein
MADEGTTGDPVPPFDESFVLGGPHEPSHEERLVEAQRRAAAERVARLRAQQAASERRSARHPARGRLRPVRGTGGGRRTFRSPSQEGGSKIVAIVLIVVAVAGLALRGVSFSSSHSTPTPTTSVTAPAGSATGGSLP